MNFSKPQTVRALAEIVSAIDFKSPPDHLVYGISEIHRVKEGDLVFVDHPKYYRKALNSKATTIIINKEVACPPNKALIIHPEPFTAFNILQECFFSFFKQANASVSSTATIGRGTIIQPNVFIGDNVVIGENCVVHANVVLQSGVVIGNHVIIQSGTIVGGDAFYYKKRGMEDYGYERLKSSGTVIIEDYVEIGSSCTIDRGVTSPTIIGMGSKIDNQIQIGHDTVIGRRCLIASQVGIAGCCYIEDDVVIWGQVGISSNIKIGEGVSILAQSGVTKDLEKGNVYFGYPAQPMKQAYKELATLRNLSKE